MGFVNKPQLGKRRKTFLQDGARFFVVSSRKRQRNRQSLFKDLSAVYLGCLLLLIAALWLTSCTEPELECQDVAGCVEISPNAPIRIAYLLAESGDASYLGVDSKGGIELAIEDREYGILGHQIELVGEDTGCDPARGQVGAQALTADPTIIGIIGANCSQVTEAALPIIDGAGLVLLSPSNTSPDLPTNQAGLDSYVRLAHNNLMQSQTAALFAYQELDARTAVIIHDGGAYTRGLAQAYAATWRELGGTILVESAVVIGQLDLNNIVAALSFNGPDVLYLPLFEPEANFVANTIRGIAGMENTILVGAEPLLLPEFAQSAGAAVNGMYIAGTAVSGEPYNDFLVKWDVKYGGAPPAAYHAHAYDATNILFNAIDIVAERGADGALLIGRQALRQVVAGTTDFPGLTGTLTCDDEGDCASSSSLGIYQITEAEIAGNQWPPALVWQP